MGAVVKTAASWAVTGTAELSGLQAKAPTHRPGSLSVIPASSLSPSPPKLHTHIPAALIDTFVKVKVILASSRGWKRRRERPLTAVFFSLCFPVSSSFRGFAFSLLLAMFVKGKKQLTVH